MRLQLTASACALLLLLALTPNQAWTADAGAKNIGFVLDVSGRCFLNGAAQPLEIGQRLPGGAVIRFSPHYSDTDQIEIALRDGSKRSVHCTEPHACDSPIRLPVSSENNHVMQTILDSLLPEGRQYVVPITRGLRQPRELVLEVGYDGVDLSPLFTDEREGNYNLVLEPVSSWRAPRRAPGPISVPVSWRPGAPLRVQFTARPGLYEATVPDLGIDEDWVLIAGTADYSRDTADMQEATSLTRQWGLSEADRHGFLRMYLASLASQQNAAP
jgi:hypothetical protein